MELLIKDEVKKEPHVTEDINIKSEVEIAIEPTETIEDKTRWFDDGHCAFKPEAVANFKLSRHMSQCDDKNEQCESITREEDLKSQETRATRDRIKVYTPTRKRSKTIRWSQCQHCTYSRRYDDRALKLHVVAFHPDKCRIKGECLKQNLNLALKNILRKK